MFRHVPGGQPSTSRTARATPIWRETASARSYPPQSPPLPPTVNRPPQVSSDSGHAQLSLSLFHRPTHTCFEKKINHPAYVGIVEIYRICIYTPSRGAPHTLMLSPSSTRAQCSQPPGSSRQETGRSKEGYKPLDLFSLVVDGPDRLNLRAPQIFRKRRLRLFRKTKHRPNRGQDALQKPENNSPHASAVRPFAATPP